MHMTITIAKRSLTSREIATIAIDIENFPDLAFVKPELLTSFSDVLVAEVDGEFAGFCAADEYRGLRKLGPIAVMRKYQGTGVGKELMKKIVETSRGKRTYLGTSNYKAKAFFRKLGAKEYGSIFQVPREILWATVHFLSGYWSVRYVYEGLRKRLKYGRGKYTFFELS